MSFRYPFSFLFFPSYFLSFALVHTKISLWISIFRSSSLREPIEHSRCECNTSSIRFIMLVIISSLVRLFHFSFIYFWQPRRRNLFLVHCSGRCAQHFDYFVAFFLLSLLSFGRIGYSLLSVIGHEFHLGKCDDSTTAFVNLHVLKFIVILRLSN